MRWRSDRTVVVGIAIVVLVVCCLLPVAYLLVQLPARLDSYGTLLDARRRGLLFNTAVLGAGTALLATAIGVPLGMILARVAFRRKALLRMALAAPAVMPPYVLALGWMYLGAADGLPIAILVLSLAFYPLSMLATEVALRRIDGHVEEAALIVAPPRRVVCRITLPLAAPSIVAAALLIFVLAASEFGVPGLLRVRVYTTEVFTAFAAFYDVGRAIALTLPLLLLCVCVSAAAAILLGDRLTASSRHAHVHPHLFEGWRRAGGISAMATIVIAVAVPVLMLTAEAVGTRSPGSVLEGSAAAVVKSLVLATLGATIVVGIAVWLGYGAARASGRTRRVADVLFVVLFALPSTVVGVGLIGLWNRAGVFGRVYGTDGMFLLAYLARFVPVAALMLAATARHVPASHEEAAAMTGSSWTRTMTHIVLPQMRLGLAAAWIVVFVLAFGELGVSVLVAPPGEATLPIRIYTMVANAPPSNVALFALLQSGIILSGFAVLGAVASLREAR